MLDIKTAYGTQTPKSPGSCRGSALVRLINDEVIEMHIFAKWIEGKRTRYNLVQFGPNNMLLRVLCGWNDDLVEVIQ